MEKITIRAFRAVDEPGLCRTFAEEHTRVLSDIGVASVVKYDEAWMSDVDTIVFVALHEHLGMIGGIRLQRARQGVPMPLEKALVSVENNLERVLGPMALRGNAELGALWNAHRFASRGVPFLLITAAAATASQAGLTHMVCFVAEYIAPYCESVGFRCVPSIGRNGEFEYPIAGMKSFVMAIPDVKTVMLANEPSRRRILSLRMRPNQTCVERPKKSDILVSYNLQLDRAAQHYRDIEAVMRRYAA